MNKISKLFVIVFALAISAEGFAADGKVTSEDVRKALQTSRLCSAGDALKGQSNLGQLYTLSLEYLESRRQTLQEDENISRAWANEAPELPSRREEFIIRKLSNWNLSETTALTNATRLIYKGGMSKRLRQYSSLFYTDWDKFFVDFVNDQKTKITLPDVGCVHYSSQRIEAPRPFGSRN